jgi:hypothetical protein
MLRYLQTKIEVRDCLGSGPSNLREARLAYQICTSALHQDLPGYISPQIFSGLQEVLCQFMLEVGFFSQLGYRN